MAVISIQAKNASYYSVINRNQKTAIGKVGVFRGTYAKTPKGSSSNIQSKLSSTIKKEQKTAKSTLLAELEKTPSVKTSLVELPDKEASDLEAAFDVEERNKEIAREAAKEKMEANRREKQQITYVGTSVYKQNGYLDLRTTSSSSSAKVKQKKKINYSYSGISSKIQMAKNSVSAGQAVIAAKRKVMELRRKASSGNVDSDDLQLALSHAKKMEMIAKKKKHNLELEEMVEHAKARDDMEEKIKDSSTAQTDILDAAKQTIENAEDEIKKQQEAYAEEIEAQFEEMAEEYETEDISSEDRMEEFSDVMSEMMEEFGEEEMEMLEETMEMLEQLEAVNPHMSDEQLDNLKRKHRASENKAIAKANMEYIKGVMKQLEKESNHNSGAVSTPTSATYSPASVANPVVAVAVETGVAVDVEC